MTIDYSVSNNSSQISSSSASSNEGTWNPNDLNTFWTDVEILGLSIALTIVFFGSIGMRSDGTNDSISIKLTDDICNRLQQLSDNNQASPLFKNLAQSSIANSNSNQGYIGKCADEWVLLKNDYENSDIASCLSHLQIEMTLDKSKFYLPEDDGTALFCLMLVGGSAAYVEHRKGNLQKSDLLNHKNLLAFPVASYYYLASKYSLEGMHDAYAYEAEDYPRIAASLVQLWSDNGSPPLPPDDGGAAATEMWNSFVAQYTDDDLSMPVNDDQNMPPYDPSVPDEMLDPYNMNGSGSDVYSKTYLMLDWMIADPEHSTNDAIGFLFFLSSVCAVADAEPSPYDQAQFESYEKIILSIQNGSGKTLVAACVDVTMAQMVINGMSPDEAALEIDALFPGDDDISIAVRTEADSQAAKWEDTYETKYDEDNVDVYQQKEEDEWAAFITDSTTIQTTQGAEAAIRTDMIEGCGNNIYSALIVILMLLQTAGILNMDAYGELSEMLQDETDQLNLIITEWSTGEAYSSSDAAAEWIKQIQDLQTEMNQTPFDETTMTAINDQFENILNLQATGYTPVQETYPNGDPMYTAVDQNGNTVYVNSEGQEVNENGDPMFKMQGYKDGNGTIVYYDANDGYYCNNTTDDRVSSESGFVPIMASGQPTPVYEDPEIKQSDTTQLNYPNGSPKYTDENGTFVNSSGQEVNSNGDPIYLSGSTYYVYDADANGGSGAFYQYDYQTGVTSTSASSTPKNATPVMGDGNPTLVASNPIYIDSNGVTYYETPGGQYVNTETGQKQTPSGTVESLTIEDQAASDPVGLQMSLEAFAAEPVNPNGSDTGGFSSQDEEIITGLNGLAGPLSSQSAMVGTEMQQETSNIELYQNTFSNIMDQTIQFETSINQNV